MSKDSLRQILIAVAVVATIFVNGLASALPINGLQAGAISERFMVAFKQRAGSHSGVLFSRGTGRSESDAPAFCPLRRLPDASPPCLTAPAIPLCSGVA